MRHRLPRECCQPADGSSSDDPDSLPVHRWMHHSAWPHDLPDWRRRRRKVFVRFVGLLGMLAMLVMCVALVTLAASLMHMERVGPLDRPVRLPGMFWVGGIGLFIILPLLMGAVAVRTFRYVATPLAQVMDAADRVAEGDLGVRLPDRGSGEFGRLARSFNRMVQELQLADQRRRNLTADVAHELRTPLHIIQGNLEGVLDGVYTCDNDHIEATLDETRLLARLIEDLRTLSLAEAGQLPLHMERVDLAELIADVVTSFSGQAESAGIALETDVPTSGLSITGDLGRLDQVLGNLVTNALRHTPAGGTISISARPLGGGVRIRVSDTGAGIPPEDLPYIFDRFWRGDRARNRFDGSGLGLAITRQLVQAHGGHIDVVSQVGSGTIFTIDLPPA